MKNNNKIGQELSEFKPVELVGCEDEEAGSPDALALRVVHGWRYTTMKNFNELRKEGKV